VAEDECRPAVNEVNGGIKQTFPVAIAEGIPRSLCGGVVYFYPPGRKISLFKNGMVKKMEIRRIYSVESSGMSNVNSDKSKCLVCGRKLPIGYPVRTCADCLETGRRGSICLVASLKNGATNGFVFGFEIVTDGIGMATNLFSARPIGDIIGIPESSAILREKIVFFVDGLVAIVSGAPETEIETEKELIANLVWPHGKRDILIKTLSGSRLFAACENLGGKKIFEQNKICLQLIKASE